MLPEALMALSAAGGTAVVQAAGTDAWSSFRVGLARWFGRDDAGVEREELERLDRTAASLAREAAAAQQRIRVEVEWATRIESLLERLAVHERYAHANALLALIPEDQRETHAEQLAAEQARTTPSGGFKADRDVTIRAEGTSSVAAGVIHGGVTIHNTQAQRRRSHPRPPAEG